MVEREVEPGTPVKVSYSLTEKGADLRPGDLRAPRLGAPLEAAPARRRLGQGDIAAAVAESELPGPFAVGRYARKLQEEMRRRARVQLVGEVTGVGRSKVQAYFELRDAEGAVPCVIWLNDLERAGLPEGALRDGAEVVDRGRSRLLPGRRPGVAELRLPRDPRAACRRGRPAGTARGAAQAAPRARASSSSRSSWRGRPCRGRSASSPPRAAPPAATCSPGSQRRGWAGTVVWAFAPVQDRRAAPAIAPAIQDLAARPEVEVDRRHPRRRQPRRPLGFLRRDALPHGRDAAGAGDRGDRPRARHDPDRRRRRRRLLDADPRCRGGRAARLRRGPPLARALRGGSAAGGGAGGRQPRPAPRRPRPRPGPRPAARACGAQPADPRDPRRLRARASQRARRSSAPSRSSSSRAARRAAGPERRSGRARRPAPGRSRAPRPRPRAHPRARLRARRGPRRGARDQRRRGARRGARLGCASPMAGSEPDRRDRRSSEKPDSYEERGRAARADHRAARLRPGRPARDARPLHRGPRAGHLLRRRARRRRRGPQGAAPRRAGGEARRLGRPGYRSDGPSRAPRRAPRQRTSRLAKPLDSRAARASQPSSGAPDRSITGSSERSRKT